MHNYYKTTLKKCWYNLYIQMENCIKKETKDLVYDVIQQWTVL